MHANYRTRLVGHNKGKHAEMMPPVFESEKMWAHYIAEGLYDVREGNMRSFIGNNPAE